MIAPIRLVPSTEYPTYVEQVQRLLLHYPDTAAALRSMCPLAHIMVTEEVVVPAASMWVVLLPRAAFESEHVLSAAIQFAMKHRNNEVQ